MACRATRCASSLNQSTASHRGSSRAVGCTPRHPYCSSVSVRGFDLRMGDAVLSKARSRKSSLQLAAPARVETCRKASGRGSSAVTRASAQSGASSPGASLATANVVVFTTPGCPYCRCALPPSSDHPCHKKCQLRDACLGPGAVPCPPLREALQPLLPLLSPPIASQTGEGGPHGRVCPVRRGGRRRKRRAARRGQRGERHADRPADFRRRRVRRRGGLPRRPDQGGQGDIRRRDLFASNCMLFPPTPPVA